jgi:hypothetical protein
VEGEGHATDLVAAAGRVVARLALVGDVAEEVALVVLRPRTAEVAADPPVDGGGALRSEAVDGEPRMRTTPRPSMRSLATSARRGASVGSGKSSAVMASVLVVRASACSRPATSSSRSVSVSAQM